MGVMAFAGKTFLGIGLIIAGIIVGGGVSFMGLVRHEYHPWSLYIGGAIFLVGAVFGIYYLRAARRE